MKLYLAKQLQYFWFFKPEKGNFNILPVIELEIMERV
jgi:hypothetical protein